MSATKGQSLGLFIDGRSDGMLTTEVFNWAGDWKLTNDKAHKEW